MPPTSWGVSPTAARSPAGGGDPGGLFAVVLAHAAGVVEDYHAGNWRRFGRNGEPGWHLAEGGRDDDAGHGRSPTSGGAIASSLLLTAETMQSSGFFFRKATSHSYAMPAREVKML